MSLSGFRAWNPDAANYRGLMGQAAEHFADAVVLAGLTEQNGAQLIKDKVALLGPNSGTVKLLAPDGFAQQSTIDLAGSASKGMFASVPGRVPENLEGPGAKLVSQLKKETEGLGRTVCAVRGPGGKRAAGSDRPQRRPRRRARRGPRDQGHQRHHRQLQHPSQRRPQPRPDHDLGREEELRDGARDRPGPAPRRGRPPRLTAM